jgi:hypothetical protein
MKAHGFCLLMLLSAMPALAAWPRTAPSCDDEEELARKIEDLNAQITELRTKSKELILERKALQEKKMEKERLRQEEERKKQEEEARREEAEKKQHFARVEAYGKLVLRQAPERWQIVVKDQPSELDFAAHPELLASARQLVGKGVIVKGTLVVTKVVVPGYWVNPPPPPPRNWQPPWGPPEGPPQLPHYPQYPPPTPLCPVPPQPQPGGPLTPPQQVLPRQNPDPTQPYLVPSYETSVVTIAVESLKLAER